MELHRWLRYALPGALFELTFGLWLYLDSRAYHSYPALPEFDTATAAAIAGATLPIGFILSVLMHTILWCSDGWPFSRVKSACILMASESAIHSKQLLELLSGSNLDKRRKAEQAHAYLDAVLHLYAGSADRKAALDRVRGLLDLMNGLATGCTAIVVSMLSIVGTVVVTWVYTGSWTEGWEWYWRFAVLVGALLLWLLLAILFWDSQRRAARITNHYLQAVLLDSQPPAAKGGT